jgi:hypothetical protein
VESVGDALGTKSLTFVPSVIAGSVEVIGFGTGSREENASKQKIRARF